MKTEEELSTVLNYKLATALDNTMKVALEKLQEFIQQEIYDEKPKWYTRTYELLNNWETTPPQTKGKIIESVLSFTGSSISWSGSPLWQHGISPVSNDSLLEIVNDGKIGDIAGFPNLGERPFWSTFERWVEMNFENEFMKQCKILGLPIATIQYTTK